MVFPKFRPISGSFFGPNTNAATPAITASSGTPNPNRHLHSPTLLTPPRRRIDKRGTLRSLFTENDAAILISLVRKNAQFVDDRLVDDFGKPTPIPADTIRDEEEEDEQSCIFFLLELGGQIFVDDVFILDKTDKFTYLPPFEKNNVDSVVCKDRFILY